MSTLKQLKLRISGIKSTQKITRAMKMVAASKLLKAQDQKDLAKCYADKMRSMLHNIASSSQVTSDHFPLLAGTGKNAVSLLVVVSSDKGLCGGFNTYLSKRTKSIIKKYKEEGQEYKILCIGRKVYDQIKNLYPDKVIEVMPGFSEKQFVYSQAEEVATKIITLFNNKAFDSCTFIYTEFFNALKQEVKQRKLIPINENIDYNEYTNNISYEYEPKQEIILEKILPLNLAVQIYYIILESIISEHGARVTAMDSATNNASDMLSDLTLQYNRSRQAAITTELIEIISGAETV